jgi:hypothetical protein
MRRRVRLLVTAGLVLGTLASSGPATATQAPSGEAVATAKQEVYGRAFVVASRHEIPGVVPVETVPLTAQHCRDHAQLFASSPELERACRLGEFGHGTEDAHCIASAGLLTRDLIFGFYVASMGFFTTCFGEDLVLACFGVIAGVGVPPGGYGPGLPNGSDCFGSTTPWLSRKTQSYTAVVVVHGLLGGPEVAFFPLSY